jgi:hypothetical protein
MTDAKKANNNMAILSCIQVYFMFFFPPIKLEYLYEWCLWVLVILLILWFCCGGKSEVVTYCTCLIGKLVSHRQNRDPLLIARRKNIGLTEKRIMTDGTDAVATLTKRTVNVLMQLESLVRDRVRSLA